MAKGHDRGPLYERLYVQLKEQIAAGSWRPGDRIPSERQLASLYGVSQITVRHALHELVLEGLVVRRVPAGTFVASPAQRRHEIGVATFGSKATDTPYFGGMLAGMQEAASDQARLRILAPPADLAPAAWLKQVAASGEVAGVILVTADPLQYAHVAHLELIGFPYVALNRRIPGYAAWSVVLNDYAIGRQAVDYLYALGHRRIAHLAGPPSLMPAADRLHGFLDGLYAHGLLAAPVAEAEVARGVVPPDALVCFGRLTFGTAPDVAAASGYEGMRALLAAAPRPTAVFAGSDFMAAGAYRAIREAGLRIPDDVSVICLSHGSTMAAALDPPLTALEYQPQELGRQSLRLLLDQLEGRVTRESAATPQARVRVVEAVFVERASCQPPADTCDT